MSPKHVANTSLPRAWLDDRRLGCLTGAAITEVDARLARSPDTYPSPTLGPSRLSTFSHGTPGPRAREHQGTRRSELGPDPATRDHLGAEPVLGQRYDRSDLRDHLLGDHDLEPDDRVDDVRPGNHAAHVAFCKVVVDDAGVADDIHRQAELAEELESHADSVARP